MRLSLRTCSKPINLILCWWILWGCVANLNFTRIIPPSLSVNLLLALMLTGLYLGTYISIKTGHKGSIFLLNRLVKRHQILTILTITTLAYFTYKSLLQVISIGALAVRSNVYSSDGKSLLFGNSQLEVLFNLTIEPLTLSLFMICLARFQISGQQTKYLYYALLLMVLIAIMRIARLPVYYWFVMYLVINNAYFRKLRNNRPKKTNSSRMPLLLAVFCIIILQLTRENAILGKVITSFVEYHTLGLSLLTLELDNPLSNLRQNYTFGGGTFGGISYLSDIFVRRINPEYISFYSTQVKDHHLAQDIGKAGTLYYNAFYTIIYTMYSDFGILGVFLIPFIFGIILRTYTKRYERNINDANALITILFIIFIFIFSVFQSHLQSHIVFLGFIYTKLLLLRIKL